MESNIHISNRGETCYVDIEGTIGVPEEWQFDDPSSRVTTYEKFKENLTRLREINAEEIVVNIRSTGGDVNDALLIYEALSSLDSRIVTRCYGYTASAATVIAQAASEGNREISANALYLIHDSICSAEGNVQELSSRIELLAKTDERLAELYARRSGHPKEEFIELMSANNGNGRWLSAEEAIAAGLADRIIDPSTSEKECFVQKTTPDNSSWSKLLCKLGLRKATEALPSDRNILHFGEEEQEASIARRSTLILREGQRLSAPTRTLPCEDPSLGDPVFSPNERAYAEDVKQFIR